MKIIKTKKNKGLEPITLGNTGIIGYDPEIHGEGALELNYKLPIGAIKRLIRSYYKDIQMYDEENVYLATYSSSGDRGKPYCYRMLSDIIKQLNKHGLNGKKIDDEVFSNGFKADYEKMKRFNKNHGTYVMYDFEPCHDPECCNLTGSPTYKIKVFWKVFKQLVMNFRGRIEKNKVPHITWHNY